jgi:hypothetical protein
MDSANLRAKTLREIKENMGQCESKERDFKEQKRRKTLEVRFYRIEKKQGVLKDSEEVRP